MRKARLIFGLVAVAATLLTVLYVRPGIWRYEYATPPVVRVDRLTGEVQSYRASEGVWYRAYAPLPSSK